jgi:imidazolonepropionase
VDNGNRAQARSVEAAMPLVITNAAQLVTSTAPADGLRRGAAMNDVVVIRDASLIADNGVIRWLGPTSALPDVASAEVLDAAGKTVIPGLVDSHTHLIWAGSREQEFSQRLEGRTYQEIAAAGGGINASVAHVRSAGKDELKRLARRRLDRLLRFGVTTVEVKSGYGLSLADELKCLQAIAALNSEGPLELVPTFLGAHAVPPEFRHDRTGYIRLVMQDMLPEIARQGLAEFCDVFCESGVFDVAESEQMLTRAQALGFRLKLHAG